MLAFFLNLKNHFADTRDTLCYATNDNQSATIELLKSNADLAIVVGGYNSSNTSHLVELLEEKFPFSDLEHLYISLIALETGINLPKFMERRNFKKKFMSLGILEELDEYRRYPGSGRPARLYRFNEKAYYEYKKRKGMGFEL